MTVVDDRTDLLRTVRSWLTDRAGHAPSPSRRDVLGEIAGLGWIGLGLPEEQDGGGGTWADQCAVLEAAAGWFVPAPLLSSAGLAAPILAAAGDPLLADVLAGTAVVATALGARTLDGVRSALPAVPDADGADWILLAVDGDLALVRAADATVTPVAGIDPSMPTADVVLGGEPTRILGAAADLEAGIDRAVLALAAVELGGADRCLALALEHVRTREQFGRPVGAFQAVAHRCADMLVHVQSARAVVEAAARALDDGQDDASLLVSAARATSIEAYAACAETGLHLHGGLGFTWEHEPHWHLRRSWALRTVLGDAVDHFDRVGRLELGAHQENS